LITYLGSECTARILDQIKTLGFRYATQAGISLGIDDLLTTPSKTWLIQDGEYQIYTSEQQYGRGSIHAVENLRHVVETWHTISEYLKREMSFHFRTTDPLNPVHMMSFSGARGNVSQVHQLVGMRGLMSNPQGNIILTPIQSNLREGLSLTEYIISCYGARKGVVDTAVRTADAGYLTRRLVEVVQHVVVRNRDCQTVQGIRLRSIRDSSRTSTSLLSLQDRLVGRVLARHVYISERCIAVRNQDLAPDVINRLVSSHSEIFVRSPLTCQSMPRACQMCYGWDLSCGNLVELGAAVGIIAGQSIGEPGTQLTLRTFHTGGVFTGDVAEHVRAPFNGVVYFYTETIQPTRNRHGRPAWSCGSEPLSVIIEDATKKKHILNVPQYSLLLVRNHQYVQAKQIIAEVRASTVPLKEKIEKDIYCGIEGEVFYEYISLRGYCLKQRNLFEFSSCQTRLSVWLEFASFRSYLSPIVDTTSYIWILSGQLIEFNGVNLNFFYKVQDYIKPELPIGSHGHILTQYEPVVRFVNCKQCLIFKNSKIPQQIFSPHIGFVHFVSEQDKWMLTLSSLDQFHITKQNMELNLTLKTYRKDSYSEINVLLTSLRTFYNSSHLTHKQISFLICNIYKIFCDIGFIGSFDGSFLKKFSISHLRKFIKTFVLYFNNYSIKETQYVFIDTNKEIATWIRSLRFVNWLCSSNLVEKFIKKKQAYLGQAICKGVAILGSDYVVPDSGHILAMCERSMIIRLAKLYLIPSGTIIHSFHKQVIHEGDTLITFAYERLKASDIIQGLPKAEQLLEARIGNQVVVHLHMRFEYLVELLKAELRNYVGSLTQMDLMLSQASVNRACKALEYSQIETVDQIQKVYLSQGVYISDKHVEVIVRQMSCKVVIVENTDLTAFSPKTVIRTSFPYDSIGIFFPGELFEISKAQRMSRVLQKPLPCKPVLLGITKASLNTNSFLSEASFERTITVLSKSALQGRMDWLKGLKENVLLSNIIPAGTGSKEVDLQAMLYKNQQNHFENNQYVLFNCRQKGSQISLYKPFFSKRDWLHHYLMQTTQQKKNFLLQHFRNGLLSVKKDREYTILSKTKLSKNINNKAESPSYFK
jgi:hypothetical protein